MKISFKMTADDYYIGWKLRNKKINDSYMKKLILLIIVVVIILIALILLTKEMFYPTILILFLIVLPFLRKAVMKNNVKKQFYTAAAANGMHTVCTYNDGLEIINSYEKMFIPWQSIYYAKETDTHFIILPTERKGIFVIDKAKYASAELDSIITAVKNSSNFKEGIL